MNISSTAVSPCTIQKSMKVLFVGGRKKFTGTISSTLQSSATKISDSSPATNATTSSTAFTNTIIVTTTGIIGAVGPTASTGEGATTMIIMISFTSSPASLATSSQLNHK